ncbi:class I SAM-dependent methyltransferase [Nocardioides montaniterrae]
MTPTSRARRIAGRLRAATREQARSAYYAAYDRDFPGKDLLGARVRRWEAGRGDVPKEPGAWDEQYAGGGWDYLSGLGEVAHYAVIAGYARHLHPGGSVLDVGCGTGVLHDHLAAGGYSRYTGVDISSVAIAALEARVPRGSADFFAVDADRFSPERSYDLVILNESLTYFPDPAATFRRYLGFVADGGFAIVSCHLESPRSRAILRSLVDEHGALDETVVRQGANSWQCAVFAGPA